MSRFDAVRQRVEAGMQPCAYDEHMGFRFQVGEMERGRTVILADVGESMHNPMGTLHGGVLCGLADSAMGSAMFTILDDGEGCTNFDLAIRFLRPTRTGRLRAEGHIVKEGRTICVAEARITDEAGDLVARADSSFLRFAVPGSVGA
jgi:uncharacterized protein (TIGR00369 family)